MDNVIPPVKLAINLSIPNVSKYGQNIRNRLKVLSHAPCAERNLKILINSFQEISKDGNKCSLLIKEPFVKAAAKKI